jgi:hypothetical protein
MGYASVVRMYVAVVLSYESQIPSGTPTSTGNRQPTVVFLVLQVPGISPSRF